MERAPYVEVLDATVLYSLKEELYDRFARELISFEGVKASQEQYLTAILAEARLETFSQTVVFTHVESELNTVMEMAPHVERLDATVLYSLKEELRDRFARELISFEGVKTSQEQYLTAILAEARLETFS
ncbi:hypothetical protein AB6A40_011785, partial [Gnathostoma spinigerum]